MVLYHVTNKRVLHKFVHSAPAVLTDKLSAMPTNDMKKMVVDDRSAKVDNEDEESEENQEPAEELESYLSVECVGFSFDDIKWLASGGMDKTLKIWDIASGACRCVCK